jgi:hypothetical protein
MYKYLARLFTTLNKIRGSTPMIIAAALSGWQ